MRKKLLAAALAVVASLGFVAVGSPAQASVNPTTYYAGGQDTPAAAKVAYSVNMYIANPAVDTGDQSLMEMTVQAASAGYTPAYRQAVLGLGWRKQSGGSTVLFAERFRNNVWGGSLVGSGDGWVDYAANATNLGATLTTSTTKNFQWIYDATGGGKWWAYYDGSALGYYPLSIWNTGAAPTYTFSAGQFFQVYGEVYDDDTTVSPCTDMGNGTLATAGGTRAFFSIAKYGATDYANMGSWSVVTNPTWYTTSPVAGTGGTGANSYIGGPGAC